MEDKAIFNAKIFEFEDKNQMLEYCKQAIIKKFNFNIEPTISGDVIRKVGKYSLGDYLGIFFALPFLVAGLLVALLSKTRAGLVAGLGLLAVLLWFNWLGQPFQFPPNNQLEQSKRIAQAVFEKTGGKPFNFALLADRNSDHAFRYFFEIWGNPPVTIEFPQKDPERKTITDQLLVLCDNTLCQPLGHPLWEIAGFGRAEVAGSWDVPFVRIYKLVHYQE